MIKLKLISSLGKIFIDTGSESELVLTEALKTEKFSFQLEIKNDNDDITSEYFVYVKGIDEKNISLYKIESVPSVLATNTDSDDYHLKKESGLYPDLLLPLRQGEGFVCPPFRSTGIWFTISSLEAGIYPTSITVKEKSSGESEDIGFELNVINAEPVEDALRVTNWLYHDCIAQKHRVKVFSKRYYEVFAKYLENYTAHGNNMIMVPLFTPPLNVLYGNNRPTVQLAGVKREKGQYVFDFSKLKEFLDFVRSYGIKYFEFSHLFSQWGAKYAPKIVVDINGVKRDEFGWKTSSLSKKYISFLKEFLPCLMNFLRKENILDKSYFHLSDEPNVNTVARYESICKEIKGCFEGRPLIDALSDYDFYGKKLVDIPVVSINKTERFNNNGADFWVYYCWEHTREYVSNRFMAMPSLRERIIGVQLYYNDVHGFLHWGFNYYNTAFSEREIDPFSVTDCDKKFPSGDAFLVYPDVKNGGAFTSVRNEVFLEAIQDYRALLTAERYYGKVAVKNVIKKHLKVDGFKVYERSDEAFNNFRKELNAMIENAGKTEK